MKRLVALALLLTAASGCSEEHGPAPEIVRPVLSVVVEPRARAAQGFAGIVQPETSTALAFRILGQVISRDADVGDLVRKGQVIAAMDPLSLDLSVQAARAELSSAEAQFANAAATEERQRALLASSNTSQAVYDSAKQARDAAAANVERSRAALAKAEEQLGYAQLSSDYDGVVTAIGAEVGQTVSAGQMVVTVARSDVREAVVDVPDSMVGDIKVGDPFDVILQSAPSIWAAGRIREIAPQADSSTRTRRVRLTLLDPPIDFRLGSTVTATRKAAVAPSIELPLSALLREGDKTSVWVVDEASATVSLRPVTVSWTGPASFIAGDGLAAGARVVTAGVHSLEPGQKVKLPRGGAQ